MPTRTNLSDRTFLCVIISALPGEGDRTIQLQWRSHLENAIHPVSTLLLSANTVTEVTIALTVPTSLTPSDRANRLLNQDFELNGEETVLANF